MLNLYGILWIIFKKPLSPFFPHRSVNSNFSFNPIYRYYTREITYIHILHSVLFLLHILEVCRFLYGYNLHIIPCTPSRCLVLFPSFLYLHIISFFKFLRIKYFFSLFFIAVHNVLDITDIACFRSNRSYVIS